MGDYDLEIELEGDKFLLEIQRVGQLKRTGKDEFKDKLEIALKEHKYQKGDSNEKVPVLWIGEKPSQVSKTYSKWFNHLIFIPNIKRQRGEVSFSNDAIYFCESFLENRSLSWNVFKKIEGKELVKIFKKLAVSP